MSKHSISNGFIRIDFTTTSRPNTIRVSTTYGGGQPEVRWMHIEQARSHYRDSMTCGMNMKRI